MTEGDSGTVNASFVVGLSDPSGQPVTVDFTTTNGAGAGGATAPADFAATSGTLTFSPGERVKPVSVPVAGDTVDEPGETFTVALSNASGATIGAGTGSGTIVDNDGAPALSVEDATAGEQSRRLTNSWRRGRHPGGLKPRWASVAGGGGPMMGAPPGGRRAGMALG